MLVWGSPDLDQGEITEIATIDSWVAGGNEPVAAREVRLYSVPWRACQKVTHRRVRNCWTS